MNDSVTLPYSPYMNSGNVEYLGITARDYFAGIMLNSLMRDPDPSVMAEDVADLCYKYADIMIAEREKK